MEKIISLYDLGEEKSGIIVSIKEDSIRGRIMEMGFLPGKEVRSFRKAAFGGPLYCVLGFSCIAMRREEADLILIKEKE